MSHFITRLTFVAVVAFGWCSIAEGKPARADEDPSYKGRTLKEWIKDLQGSDKDNAVAAAKAIGNIGLKAKAALPALIEALRYEDYSVRAAVEEAFGQIGEPAVPALIEELKGKNKTARAAAASALGHIGSDAAAAIPVLAKAVEDEDYAVSHNAAEALGKIGEAGIPALLRGLNHDELEVQKHCARGLELMGRNGRKAIPSVQRLLKDKDSTRRKLAAEILGQIAKGARADLMAEVVPALTECLKDPVQDVRFAAAVSTIKVKGDLKSALPIWVEMWEQELKDGKNRFSFEESAILDSLVQMGSDAKSAAPVLVRVYKKAAEKKRYGSEKYAKAIWAIDAETAKAEKVENPK